MKLVLRLFLFALPTLAGACSSTPLAAPVAGNTGTSNTQSLTDPGWFDVGLGFGAANTGPDSSGFLLSVKAYPAGRWYAFRKSGNDQASEKLDTAKETLADLRAAAVPNPAAIATAETELAIARSDALSLALSNPAQEAVEIDGAKWYNRFSVFFATSVSGFKADGPGGGDDLVGSFTGVGIGFDIAPQFSVQFGYGLYDPDGSWRDEESTFVAVSLNANAFRALFSEVNAGN